VRRQGRLTAHDTVQPTREVGAGGMLLLQVDLHQVPTRWERTGGLAVDCLGPVLVAGAGAAVAAVVESAFFKKKKEQVMDWATHVLQGRLPGSDQVGAHRRLGCRLLGPGLGCRRWSRGRGSRRARAEPQSRRLRSATVWSRRRPQQASALDSRRS